MRKPSKESEKFSVRLSLAGQGKPHEVLILASVADWGHAARLSGPPEDCYPAEGPELDECEIYLLQGDRKRRLRDSLEEKIIEDEFDAIFEKIYEQVEDYRENY